MSGQVDAGDRRVDEREETSSRRAPGTPRTAAAMASTAAASRPSETFGTHSMIVRMRPDSL